MRTPGTLAALLSLLLLTASPARPQVRVEPVPGASAAAGGSSGGSLGSLGGSSASPLPLAPAALPGALALPAAAPPQTPTHAAPAASAAPAPSATAFQPAAPAPSAAPGAVEMSAQQAVLAAAAEAFPEEDWSQVLGSDPGDAQMRAETYKLLSALRKDPRFARLPPERRDSFDRTLAYFSEPRTPEAWATASAPTPARAPPAGTNAARRYIRDIAGGMKLTDRQTEGLLEQFFEEKEIPLSSPQAQAIIRELLPAKAAADAKATAGLDPRLAPYRGALVRLAAERGITPAAVEAALKRRGMLSAISGMSGEQFSTQAALTLDREELRLAVAAYPDSAQGEFMKEVASHMSSPSGKSIEEVSRDGVFGYVDFAGRKVLRASAGRDPDVTSCQVVFYITRRDGRWRIGGYRQNRRGGTKDAEYEEAVKQWLIEGGIPSRDLE